MQDKAEATGSSLTGAVSKKRDNRRIKRDHRSWDNVMKAVSHFDQEKKWMVIEEKYKELFNEARTTTISLKESERKLALSMKENQHLQAEMTKLMLSRSKMETLARELQKQNKEVKEENFNRLKEEEEKRKVVAATFTDKLNALTALMDENTDKSLRLREENLNMTSKLSELYTQFQEREAHLSNMNNQMELQRKLSEAQLKKLEVEFEAERHMWQNEKMILLDQLQKSEETNKVLQEHTKSLQEHLNTYQKQYNDFETTMKRSSEVFDNFKDEIAKMHKSNAILEKERNEWHSRWQSSTQTVIHLTELNQQAENAHRSTERKLKMLEKLCRKLNSERSAYIQQLKDNNLVPVSPPKEDDDELVAKEKQLVFLKSELKAIQEQIHNNDQLDKLQSSSNEFKQKETQRKDTTKQKEPKTIEAVNGTDVSGSTTVVQTMKDDVPSVKPPEVEASSDTFYTCPAEVTDTDIPLEASEAQTDLEEARLHQLAATFGQTNIYDPTAFDDEARVLFSVAKESKEDEKKKKQGGDK